MFLAYDSLIEALISWLISTSKAHDMPIAYTQCTTQDSDSNQKKWRNEEMKKWRIEELKNRETLPFTLTKYEQASFLKTKKPKTHKTKRDPRNLAWNKHHCWS